MKSRRRSTAGQCIVFLALIWSLSVCPAASNQTSTASSSQHFDGPAELPREYVKSSLRDTPTGGKTLTVGSDQSIEKTLASASCGDIVELQAGARFAGSLILPVKNCDDSHWIIIRTSAPDSSLPPEGARLTPCYAGVSSLPGRPQWNCTSTANVLARIESGGGAEAVQFSAGANHYRLIGLEITSTAAGHDLIEFLGASDHIVFDRVWIHGTPQGETTRGIMLGQTRYVAVVDSFFSDFHCIARSGSCSDAQAIAGGIGDGPMGPYKIVNNFLEASGENILFGGGRGTATPQDIEIRRNHMFKPLTWMKGQPGYVGGKDGNPFIAKNLFELKNAQRVLLEGNILENSWGGFTQGGFGIVLTPKNQGGTCPSCRVTDITIRYDSIRHVGSGMQIANAPADNGATAVDGQRYSIHDVVIDDIDGKKYSGPSELAQISVNPGAPLLQNVVINHVTAFPAHTLFVIGDMVATSTQMKNFVFVNSIVNAGDAPVWSTGGGPANCAFHDNPRTTFEACFTGSSFVRDAIIDAPYGASNWPANNFFPKSAEAVRFANYNGGNGGDYRLQPSSPFRGKGTDGKDLGADMDAVRAATAGVE
jgi:hypothetical protein